MLCMKVTAVYSEIHAKNIYAFYGENVKLLNVKPGDTYSDH